MKKLNVSHAYNKVIAMDIVLKTKTLYVDMFKELKRELEANWISR